MGEPDWVRRLQAPVRVFGIGVTPNVELVDLDFLRTLEYEHLFNPDNIYVNEY